MSVLVLPNFKTLDKTDFVDTSDFDRFVFTEGSVVDGMYWPRNVPVFCSGLQILTAMLVVNSALPSWTCWGWVTNTVIAATRSAAELIQPEFRITKA
jgi:hypothetical protein